MTILLIIISWILSFLPAVDYICNKGKIFKIATDKEWLEATAIMLIPVINLIALATVAGNYFKDKSK